MKVGDVVDVDQLSVPFSSGQWLLLGFIGGGWAFSYSTFSPLFIGAMVATPSYSARD